MEAAARPVATVVTAKAAVGRGGSSTVHARSAAPGGVADGESLLEVSSPVTMAPGGLAEGSSSSEVSSRITTGRPSDGRFDGDVGVARDNPGGVRRATGFASSAPATHPKQVRPPRATRRRQPRDLEGVARAMYSWVARARRSSDVSGGRWTYPRRSTRRHGANGEHEACLGRRPGGEDRSACGSGATLQAIIKPANESECARLRSKNGINLPSARRVLTVSPPRLNSGHTDTDRHGPTSAEPHRPHRPHRVGKGIKLFVMERERIRWRVHTKDGTLLRGPPGIG